MRRSASIDVEGGDLGEQVVELGLARLGEQEVVERLEAAALIRARDLRAAADQIGEQLALGSVPGGDLLPGGAVQSAEVLLDLPEVREQFPRRPRQLLVAVADRGRVEHRHGAGLDGGDLGVDLIPAPAQLRQPNLGLFLGAVHDLAQQFDHGVQPGLGSHEGAALQGHHPGVGLLEGRGDLVVHLVVAGRVEPSQVGGLGGRPVLQVGARLLGESRLAAVGGDLGVQGVQLVVQGGRELAGRTRAPIALDEEPAQEGQDQHRVAGAQQSPGGVAVAQRGDRRVVHQESLGNAADNVQEGCAS